MSDDPQELPEINLDADLANADWPKRTIDTTDHLEALGRFKERTGIDLSIDEFESYVEPGDEADQATEAEPAKAHDCEGCDGEHPCPKCQGKSE